MGLMCNHGFLKIKVLKGLIAAMPQKKHFCYKNNLLNNFLAFLQKSLYVMLKILCGTIQPVKESLFLRMKGPKRIHPKGLFNDYWHPE